MNQRIVTTRFPFFPLSIDIVTRSGTRNIEVEAALDTGFDGEVILPATYLDLLGEPESLYRWRMADGSVVLAPHYLSRVQVLGLETAFPAIVSLLGPAALVGRGISDQFRITLDHGQELSIEL